MRKINLYFVIIMAVLIGLFLICLFFPPTTSLLAHQKVLIFQDGRDLFADFFNVLRYMSDEAGFYYSSINEQDGHGGFPLSLGLFYPLAQLVDYSQMTLQDCWASHSAMLTCIFYLLVLLFFFWDSLNRVCQKYGVSKWNLVILLFSSVFIFSVERGNSIFFAATLLNYYLVYYDHKAPCKRYLALVFLCVVATHKGFPALFGLLLLKERRYRDIAFCVILTLLLVFVPFLFLEHGLDTIPQMVRNTAINSATYLHSLNCLWGFHRVIHMACLIGHVPEAAIDTIIAVARMVAAVLVLLTIGLVLLEDRLSRQLLLIACAILLYPVNSGFYCGLYFFPVILIFFSRGETTRRSDYVILLLLCMMICPLQLTLLHKDGTLFRATPVLANAAVTLLWLYVLSLSLKSCLPKLWKLARKA